MLKTVRLRFETHFDIYDKLLLLDSTNPACAGMKALKNYLKETRNTIISVSSRPVHYRCSVVSNFRPLSSKWSRSLFVLGGACTDFRTAFSSVIVPVNMKMTKGRSGHRHSCSFYKIQVLPSTELRN